MFQKSFGCTVKDVTAEEGGTKALVVASTSEQDRDGEYLKADGVQFIPGAQLLYGHNWGDLRANLGTILSADTVGEEVHALVRFDDAIPEHTDAIIAAKKAKLGSLSTLSVGFEPHLVKSPDGKVTELARGEWMYPERGRTYLKWSLLELSFVPVPSNPGTGVIDVRSLQGPAGKALRAAIREALDSILGSDEFLSRMKSIVSPKSGEGEGAPSAGETPGAAPAAPAATRAPSDLALDLDELLKDPVKLALTTDNPEEVARALAAASGRDALDDLDTFFNEAAPAGAGIPGA